MTTYKSFDGKDVEQVANLDDLRELLAADRFHHATYRDIGKCHEGLYIYAKDANGFRGFSLIGSFPGGSHATPAQRATLIEAEKLVRPLGTSVGSYGNG